MKKASNILYKIGKVFNIIEIVGLAFLLIMGVTIVALAPSIFESLQEQETELTEVAEVSALGFLFIIIASIAMVISILALVFCAKSKKAIDQGEKNVKPYVITIVFGAINESIFYILSGIFALVVRNKETNVIDAK